MMSAIEEGQAKLAPIFAFKTNKMKEKVIDRSDDKKRKRIKKSPKNKSKKKTTKRFDNSSGDNEAEERGFFRRSKRLRCKVAENEEKLNYCEDTDEEVVCDNKSESPEEVVYNLNESVILLEEDSNTIDYWTDDKTGQCLQLSSDDDIEILPSNNSSKFNCQISQETVTSTSSQSGEQKECLLWSEKYKPTNSSEMIGHKVAVNRLKSWLEDWGKSVPKRNFDYDSEDDSDNCLDETNACLLICGPTGSGKTSMVYAIAEELKYEVLELNASMKRNGRMITKILSEATQSHQMQRNNDTNGLTPSIQSFFSSIGNNAIKRGDNDIKIVKTNKKKKTNGILNYFSKHSQNSVEISSEIKEIKVIDDKVEGNADIQSKGDSIPKTSERSSNDCSFFARKALSIATNSLILFDDIDVMIDDDFIGFWSAFNKINGTTKKPVILTATQYVPYIKECVNRLQVLSLKSNTSDTIDGLKRISDIELDGSDSKVSEEVCRQLSVTYDNDIRRCLNHLQFGTDCQQMSSQTKVLSDKKTDMTSYYDSLLFADVMQTQFGIESHLENRNNWMNCKPNRIENEFQTITVAKDIVETINELNYNSSKRRIKEFSEPIDSQTIESISEHLSPNTNLRTILMDYCPYLSFICHSESIRQSKIANHSRKSRRFMHYLDSIGFDMDSMVRTKLVSSFASQLSDNTLDDKSEESNSSPKMDDYFYE